MEKRIKSDEKETPKKTAPRRPSRRRTTRKSPPREQVKPGKADSKEAVKEQSRKPSRSRDTKPSGRRKRAYALIINRADFCREEDLPTKLAERLQRRLRRAGWDCTLDATGDWDEFEKLIAQSIRRRPYAVVIFGGDGSVRLAATRISRAKGLLGIVPCGLFNNIFHSLYGHDDPEQALDIIRAGYQARIDAGTANGTFFLGSLVTGVVPGIIDQLGTKKLPRMAITWAKMGGRAADEAMPRSVKIKVDFHTFEEQPSLLNIHLLPRLISLNFAPAAVPDDGRLVLLFDRECTRDDIAHYIRDLKKDKYQYIENIHMVRGHRISISPATGRTWLMDGEIVEFAGREIIIEVLDRVLRVFANAPETK